MEYQGHPAIREWLKNNLDLLPNDLINQYDYNFSHRISAKEAQSLTGLSLSTLHRNVKNMLEPLGLCVRRGKHLFFSQSGVDVAIRMKKARKWEVKK
jgi:hypothetical protein